MMRTALFLPLHHNPTFRRRVSMGLMQEKVRSVTRRRQEIKGLMLLLPCPNTIDFIVVAGASQADALLERKSTL